MAPALKPLARELLEGEEGVLIIDDTISSRSPTHRRELALVCWHYDHSKGRNLKGMNLLSALYQVGDVSIPVAFESVKKPE